MIRVIDIETTGTDPATCEIIEIASVDMVRGGGITNAMDTLLRPSRPIPPGASAVHHLIDADVQDAPRFANHPAPPPSADGPDPGDGRGANGSFNERRCHHTHPFTRSHPQRLHLFT